MTDTTDLKLTRDEALALDALAEHAADRLFMDANGKAAIAYHISIESAASACDKLHRAALGEFPVTLSWSHFLAMRTE
jgi:hypothetical protein